MNQIKGTNTPNLNQSSTTPSSTHSMWDAFEHVLLFISLYIFATAFALLLHFFVDRIFPSSISTTSYLSGSSYYSTIIRGYLAAIIVSYPFFAFLFLRITKRTFELPDLRKIHARKTLIYITLIVTFIIGLINLISIVYNFLGGNINLNFLLHFFVTFIVSGIIFLYYLNQVRSDKLLNA